MNTDRRAKWAATAAVSFLGISLAQATPSNRLIVVPPSQLPAAARADGQAMLLRQTMDGRTLLYIEQDNGSRLAGFDVTDPLHVKSEGAVRVGEFGPFDFVAPLGTQAELIRFRENQGSASLNFHKGEAPDLKLIEGLTLPGSVTPLGNDGFMIARPVLSDASLRNYQVVDTGGTQNLNPLFEVAKVRDEVTNADTGTTFLLTPSGLYLIRRPEAEADQRLRAQEWFEQHTGG